MIDPHYVLPPEQRQHTRRNSDALQGRSHSRAFGITYTGYFVSLDGGFLESLLHEFHNPFSMVFGRVLGKEALTGRGYKGVSYVG